MFPGYFHKDGHSDVKHRKGFKDIKKFLESQTRKSNYVSPYPSTWRSRIKESNLSRRIGLLISALLMIGLFVGVFVAGNAALANYGGEDHISKTHYLKTERQKAKEEAIHVLEYSARGYFYAGHFEEALDEYKKIIALDASHKLAREKVAEIDSWLNPNIEMN